MEKRGQEYEDNQRQPLVRREGTLTTGRELGERSEDVDAFHEDDVNDLDFYDEGKRNRRKYDYLYGYDYLRPVQPALAEVREEKRNQIIKQALAEFDLHDVMERYRGHVLDSLQARTHGIQFRLWMQEFTGQAHNDVHFSDTTWAEHFRKRLQQDIENAHKEQELHLAEVEKQRIQKLRILGLEPTHKGNNSKLKRRNKTSATTQFQRAERTHKSSPSPTHTPIPPPLINKKREGPSDSPCDEVDGCGVKAEVKNRPTDRQEMEVMVTETPRKWASHPKVCNLFQHENLASLYKEAESMVQVSGRK